MYLHCPKLEPWQASLTPAAQRGAQKADNHTVSDYETLAELEYAFIVWRTNLKRDLSLTNDHEVRL